MQKIQIPVLDPISFETGYKIGMSIQKEVKSTDGRYTNQKPWAYTGCFKNGPKPHSQQTKQGYVLQFRYQAPSLLLTPFGKWPILDGGHGDWDRVKDNLNQELGLVLFNKTINTEWGPFGPWYAVTEFEGEKFEWPSYIENPADFRSAEKIQAAWAEFVQNRTF